MASVLIPVNKATCMRNVWFVSGSDLKNSVWNEIVCTINLYRIKIIYICIYAVLGVVQTIQLIIQSSI